MDLRYEMEKTVINITDFKVSVLLFNYWPTQTQTPKYEGRSNEHLVDLGAKEGAEVLQAYTMPK